MWGSTKSRRLVFLVAVYIALPTALITVATIAWMAAVENATVALQSADSPDGRYRAEVVREDPGVSSNYEYMVRLMPSGLTPLAKDLRVLPFGPVYVALDVHREPDQLSVWWSGAKEVTIQCAGCNASAPKKESWRDVRVKYEVK